MKTFLFIASIVILKLCDKVRSSSQEISITNQDSDDQLSIDKSTQHLSLSSSSSSSLTKFSFGLSKLVVASPWQDRAFLACRFEHLEDDQTVSGKEEEIVYFLL